MNVVRALFPLLAFTAGLSGTFWWRVQAASRQSGQVEMRGASSALARADGKARRSELSKPTPPALQLGVETEASPSMDDVLNAAGFRRVLLMTRYIQTAGPDDLRELCRRQPSAEFWTPDMTRLFWARWVEVDPDVVLSPLPVPPPFKKEDPWLALAALDSAKALALSPENPPELRKAILSFLARRDPSAVRKLLADRPDMDSPQLREALFFGSMATDPAGAMTAGLQQRNGQFAYVFGDWLRHDPDAARKWMATLTNPQDQEIVRQAVFDSRLQTDPAGAVTEAEALPAGPERNAKLTAALTALAARDPAEAGNRALSLSDPITKSGTLAAMAESLTTSNPNAALDLLRLVNWRDFNGAVAGERGQGQTPDDPGNSKLREALLSKLTAASPQSTLEILAKSCVSDSAAPVAEAMRGWLSLQPEAASAWLRGLPAGPAKDQGVRAITSWLTSGEMLPPDYPAAMAWAQNLTGPESVETFSRIARQWAAGDPDQARGAVQALAIPDKQKLEILQSLAPSKTTAP